MQVQYGGRVTDDFDKRLLNTITHVWFTEALISPAYKFYDGYPVPEARNIDEYNNYIQNMPLTDVPEVFGLHKNADISYQVMMMMMMIMMMMTSHTRSTRPRASWTRSSTSSPRRAAEASRGRPGRR